MYEISHSKQVSINSNTDNPLGTPQILGKQPILTEAAEESRDDNVFSFNKNVKSIIETTEEQKQETEAVEKKS